MAPDLSFGPAGDQWHYDKASRTYDLTRGKGKSLTVETSGGPADTFISVSPELTSLVVVDMQNFFLHPRCRDHQPGLAAVEATKNVLKKCREVGVQVTWLNWGLTDQDLLEMPASIQRSFARSAIDPAEGEGRIGLGMDLGDGKGRCLMAGQWNSDIFRPLRDLVLREDAHCPKNRMSGMWNSTQPLWKHLEDKGIRTLLFAGVNTDQCVYGTLVDAYNSGWDCIMVEDCCATKTPGAQAVCKQNMVACYGFVINSDTFARGRVT